MKKYFVITTIILGIAAYCWPAVEGTYRYPAEGTLPGATLIILVGEDVSFEEAVALRARNLELETELQAARAEIAGLRGRMGRAVDDLNIVEGYLAATAPAAAQPETPAVIPGSDESLIDRNIDQWIPTGGWSIREDGMVRWEPM